MTHKRLYRYLWILAGTIVLGGASFFFADMPLAEFFETNRNPVLRWLGESFSLLGLSQWYLVPGGLIGIFCWRSRPAWSKKGWYVFLSVASTGILSNLIKVCTGRYRPKVYFEQGITGFSPFHPKIDELAFPSGHATTAFAAAVALGYLLPRFRWYFYAVATLVAFSRVLLVKHWLSDVIAGAWLGAAGAVLCWAWIMGGQGETHEQK
jgi:membrane-associated phospholipid phosphatase